MKLKVYADRMSQPSRAVIVFCNGKPHGASSSSVDERLKLFESLVNEAPLMCVLSRSLDQVVLFLDYPKGFLIGTPNDLFKRARIHSVLDWHHSNLRRGAAPFLLNTVPGPAFAIKLNPQAAAEAEKLLLASLSKIESFWLKGNGKFLLGSSQPSIADLCLVCEIMQLEVLDEKERNRILGPYKKVQRWIDNTKNATRPHFVEVHTILFKAKARPQEPLSERAINEASKNRALHSKM